MSVLSSPWLAPSEVAERPVEDLDRVLALRAKSGDRAALRAIYERHAPAVQRFVRDLLRDGAARDGDGDALQDTFVRVFQRIESLEDPDRLVGWIFGIARHVCQEHRRAAARRGGLFGWLGLGATASRAAQVDRAESLLTTAEHPGPTPEAALLGKESASALERALGELSPDRRALLLLRCDHQLSYEEIATAMGFSLPKVKVEIFRARQALRAALFGESEV